MSKIYTFIGCLVLLMMAACTPEAEPTPTAAPPTPDVVTISGTVIENDRQSPADGSDVLVIEVDDSEMMRVLYFEGGLVPADMADDQCTQNQLAIEIAQTVRAGDVVEVTGNLLPDGTMEICSSTDYSITIVEAAPASEGENSDMVATREVSGEVVEFISDCAFDGNCAYVVETAEGERVTVIWAEGNSPICQNDPFNGGDTDIAVGDTLEALGRVIDETTISGCGDESYFITKTS